MPLNPKMKLWNKLVSDYRKKHGVSLKEAMQSKTVKQQFERKKRAMEGKKTSPRKTSGRKTSPMEMSSPKRKTTSPRRRRR